MMQWWIDAKMNHYSIIMVDKGTQMDELQSGPLMVKSLMGICFVDWFILEEWLEDPCSHYCLIMIDKVQKWMNSKAVPLWLKSSQEDALQIDLSLKNGWRTHACMWNNEMNIKEIVGETILDG